MTDQSEHDEIGILSIHTVPGIGLVIGLVSHISNVLHDFMFSFTWDIVAGVDYFEVFPEGVFLDLFTDEEFDAVGYFLHEFCSWCDAVAVKDSFIIELFGFRVVVTVVVTALMILFIILAGSLCHILGTSKSSRTLLIELGPWCNSVNGHEYRNFGFNNLCNDSVEVVHDSKHHIFFREDVRDVHVIGMRTSVNDTIHIEVEVIEFGQERGIGDDLIDLWVAFA